VKEQRRKAKGFEVEQHVGCLFCPLIVPI